MTLVSFQRAARTAAAGAFIFALSLTSLGSSAVAAPAADKDGEKGCSALAHVRNEAVSDLRDAWRGFRKEVREMAHDARDLRKESSDRAAFTALMTELRDANGQLDSIRKGAREQMQTLFSATVCKEQAAKAEKDGDNDEDQATELSPEATALATQLDGVLKTAVSDMKAVTVALKATVASALEAAKATEKAKAKDDDEDEDKDEDHDTNHERKGHDENEATEDRDEHATERLMLPKVELNKSTQREGRDSGSERGDHDSR